MEMPYVMPADFAIVSQHVCGPTEQVRKAITEQFGEDHSELIFSDERVAMTLHRGKQTWTIALQFSNGTSCVVAAGKDWPVPQKS